MRLVLASFLAAGLFAGCLASGSADVQYGGGVAVATPDLVEVSPGVQVVADYDDSVFYSDGYYWRNDNGGWYRSTYYSGGWSYWASPPSAIIRINDPYRYRNYRPSGYQPRHQPYRRPEPIRDHRQPEPYRQQPREGGVEVRDHRQPEPYREPERRPEPGPVVRDHREPEPVHEAPRPAPGPVERDHRNNTPPPRKEEKHAPVERDHR
ncbi:MAG TPA: hypothetical protein VGC41_29490 [Kofleriaceae bacterium]